MTVLTPETPAEVAAAVRDHARVTAHGRRTKAPLVPDNGPGDADAARLDMTRLTGVSEYQPSEYTFTARAATSLTEIVSLLAENGQYMPFDPPFAEQGATIGGTVAAGVNGPGRLRYGGLRDFVIGVRFVDGTGTLIGGGGKVVKNAAGFDLPKLMVGSMGRLGVITELSFKVFPAPQAWRTLRVTCRDLEDAIARIAQLSGVPLELEALDLEPPGTLLIRVSGDEAAVDAHAVRVGAATGRPYVMIPSADEARYWNRQREFAWAGDAQHLIKVPLTLKLIARLDDVLERQQVDRRYSVAGNVAWLAWPATRPVAELDLAGLQGLIVRGPGLSGRSPWLGPPATQSAVFAQHVRNALDPDRRLPELVG